MRVAPPREASLTGAEARQDSARCRTWVLDVRRHGIRWGDHRRGSYGRLFSAACPTVPADILWCPGARPWPVAISQSRPSVTHSSAAPHRRRWPGGWVLLGRVGRQLIRGPGNAGAATRARRHVRPFPQEPAWTDGPSAIGAGKPRLIGWAASPHVTHQSLRCGSHAGVQRPVGTPLGRRGVGAPLARASLIRRRCRTSSPTWAPLTVSPALTRGRSGAAPPTGRPTPAARRRG